MRISKSYDGDHDTKRPRACDACRALKVRCDQDVNHPGQSCTRCLKANRPCVVTPPIRKRQRKSENKVVELEKKIDALTATLLSKQQNSTGSVYSASPHSESPSAASPRERLTDKLEPQNQQSKRRSVPPSSACIDEELPDAEQTEAYKKRKTDAQDTSSSQEVCYFKYGLTYEKMKLMDG